MSVWQVLEYQGQKQQEHSDNYSCKGHPAKPVVAGKAGMHIFEFPINIIEIRALFWTQFEFYINMRNSRNDEK